MKRSIGKGKGIFFLSRCSKNCLKITQIRKHVVARIRAVVLQVCICFPMLIASCNESWVAAAGHSCCCTRAITYPNEGERTGTFEDSLDAKSCWHLTHDDGDGSRG